MPAKGFQVGEEEIRAAQRATGSTDAWCALALEAAAPLIYEQALSDLRDWLGSDDEYDALGAIHESLKASPQLVPERDVPLRLLAALRAAVDRFLDTTSNQGVGRG